MYMATLAAAYIGTDRWNAEVYGTLAFASRLAEAVKQRKLAYRVAYSFWKLNSSIDGFLDDIHNKLRKAQNGVEVSSEPVDPARIQNAIDSLHKLHMILDGIYQNAVRYRLTNHSIVAAGVSKLHRNDERVVELAEWIHDMMHPQPLEEIFTNARAEFERGETVALAD